MSYRIAAVSITDYKRLREVTIKPDADRMVILLAGDNAQGKSSILDAIEAALGGKSAVAADPVRHGADEARIEIQLVGEAPLIVKRKIESDGTTSLELRDEIGAAVRSPQAVLDKLVGARFLDPIAFLMLKAPEQRKHLLQLIDGDGSIAKLDERRTRCFDLRTEVNRDHKKAAAEFERVAGSATEPAAAVDLVDLSKQLTEIQTVVHTLQNKRTAHDRAKMDHERAQGNVAHAEAELEAAKRRLESAQSRKLDAEKAELEARAQVEIAEGPAYDASGQRAAIEQQIANAQEHNRKAAADAVAWKRRKEIETELQRLALREKELTGEIQKIETEKSERLAASKLPVQGLSVDSSGVLLNSVPLAQASGAEKQRVALALAIAANPNLRDVWIRDGALLDEHSLKLITDVAAAASVRVWIERVGTQDQGAIIIHDGRVVEPPPPTQGTLFQ